MKSRIKKIKKLKTTKGFTLIELMVSSAIFIIVMVVAIGAVLSIVDANRKAQTINSVMTNINFALETMVREINTGHDICSSSCSDESINFYDSDGVQTTYRKSGNSLVKDINPPIGHATINIPITAPEVIIDTVSFSIKGPYPSDHIQPIVLIILAGKVGVTQKTQSAFRIQTITTQRRLDS